MYFTMKKIYDFSMKIKEMTAGIDNTSICYIKMTTKYLLKLIQ